MGHGGGDDEMAEPNLTALLDLVLQMVMFFMVVASFVSEQTHADIQLPVASQTVPIDKEQQSILMLNVEGNSEPDPSTGRERKYGRLLLPPKYSTYFKEGEVFDSPASIANALKLIYGLEKNPKNLTVVIRGDQTSNFNQVYRVLRAAKDAGFEQIQLRAKFQKN